jgi:hypothetical protein
MRTIKVDAGTVGLAAGDELLSDTITALVQTYFDEKIERFAGQLTASWSVDGEEGRRDAFEILSRVTNDACEESEKYLNKKYHSDTSDEAVIKRLNEAKEKLLVLSKCVNGRDDEIFRQCARFTDEAGVELRGRIGNFLKAKMNEFIKEKFPDLLEDCVRAEAGTMIPASVVANDEGGVGGGGGASTVIYDPVASRLYEEMSKAK